MVQCSQSRRRRAGLFAAAGAAAFGVAAFSVAGAASAQTTPDAAAPAAQPTGLSEVVVTAQRRAQNLQDVPVSVQALSAGDLQAAGIKSTVDLGQITPNVTIVSPVGQGNQPLITIRGIGLNDFDTNNAGPNGVYLDDVYISAPSAQSFAIFDLNQVQVLKGPQGTLYGRNTSGGALVFTTARPTDHFTTDLHVEYGNYNTVQVAGAVGGPITDQIRARISGVINRSDGFFDNALTGDPIDNVSNEAIRLQLEYRPNDKLKLYFESTVGYLRNHPAPYDHIGTYVPGTQGDAEPQTCSPSQAFQGGCVDLFGYGTPGYWKGSFNRLQDMSNLAAINQFRADYRLGSIDLTSITSWQYDKKFMPEETDASPNSLLSATYGVLSNTITQEFRASHSSSTLNWVGGIYYLHEVLRQNQPLELFYDGDLFGGFGIPAGPGAFDGIAQRSFDLSSQQTDTAALFGQGDYTWNQWTLTLGARYTWEQKSFLYDGSTQYQTGGRGNFGVLQNFIHADESQSNYNTTWRAALSYHFTPRIQGYASAATGFKSGDFNGSFLSNDEQQALRQLQPVRPEKVTSYEIGEKATFFDRRLVLNAAAFYNDYSDEQIFAAVPQTLLTGNGMPIDTTTQVITNAKSAHTEGVEAQLTALLFPGLTVDLQPAWLQARLDDAGLPLFVGVSSLNGKQLANAPRFTFSGSFNYRYALPSGDHVDVRWNSNYRSHVWFDSTNDPYIQQDGYWLHNLNVTYQSQHGWDVGVYVRNIADEKYATTSTDLSVPFGVLEPVEGTPRMYGVQLSYHY